MLWINYEQRHSVDLFLFVLLNISQLGLFPHRVKQYDLPVSYLQIYPGKMWRKPSCGWISSSVRATRPASMDDHFSNTYLTSLLQTRKLKLCWSLYSCKKYLCLWNGWFPFWSNDVQLCYKQNIKINIFFHILWSWMKLMQTLNCVFSFWSFISQYIT